MIEQLELQHYGMHHTLVWNKLGRINLLVGENGTGKTFIMSRDYLRDLIGGRVDFDDKTGAWYYYQGKNHYTIGETAEGIKK